MSDLDMVLRYVEELDPISANYRHLAAARTELAALRQRAEDAEAMLRHITKPYVTSYGDKNERGITFRREMFGNPPHFDVWFNASDHMSMSGGLQLQTEMRIKCDPTTGLPILTDEAREALK